ncbi:hypothetical protein EZ449_12895 [Pedobacter frigidisoli]|uniref:Uncharacterized protein n=1 Tax=Pedobacter frigidisoli TaxID=2530455 RepID=A0A4R0NZF6_9SPHI|nr:hypothetical protein [Pedobacter frigidisoli]TCD08295.1 hypothetical protein EZ449_12895 [Pedobacter frigidisoli]
MTPNEWKAFVKIADVRALGNLTLDFEWKDGKVTTYKVYSLLPTKLKIRINGKMINITSQKS